MTNTQTLKTLRENKLSQNLITGIIFTFAFLGVLLNFITSLQENKPLDMIAYFTNQSNIIVTITLALSFTKLKDKSWFKYLALVALVDILMTGIIYHLIVNGIASFTKVSFSGHLVHTISPLLYPIFYYLLVKKAIPLKNMWVPLIHPLLYFLYFVILGPVIKWYPYNFLNPTLEGSSLGSVLFFCLVVLLPIILLFTAILVILKNQIEKKNN